jgi:hypothetical protein
VIVFLIQESVLQRCSETMAENITKDNVLLVLETSEKYGLELLKKNCITYLEQNFCHLASGSTFLKKLTLVFFPKKPE